MRTPVIDADGHIEEDLAALVAGVPEKLRDLAPRFLADDDGVVSYMIEGKKWVPKFPFPMGMKTHTGAGGEYREGGKDPRMRIDVLDSEGIDAAVLFPSTGMMFGLYEDVDVASALCRSYNDRLAEYCARNPNRLIGVALLPQQDPVKAVDELERAVEQLGFVGAVMRPNMIAGRTVDHPDWESLWAAAAALDVPVVFHEAYLSGIDLVGQQRFNNYAVAHVAAHPFEQMTAMLALTVDGVFDRYPTLRLGFFEGGCGWAPFWAERIEEHYELAPKDFRGGDPHGTLPGRAYITFEVDERALPAAVELGWGDNICYASDYPHFDAVFPGSVKAVRERGLDPDVEAKLLAENALTFYGDRLRRLVEPVLKEA